MSIEFIHEPTDDFEQLAREYFDAFNIPAGTDVERLRMLAHRHQAILQAHGKCTWKEEDGGAYWSTTCGETYTIITGSPSENGFHFCQYCGKIIDVKREE